MKSHVSTDTSAYTHKKGIDHSFDSRYRFAFAGYRELLYLRFMSLFDRLKFSLNK